MITLQNTEQVIEYLENGLLNTCVQLTAIKMPHVLINQNLYPKLKSLTLLHCQSVEINHKMLEILIIIFCDEKLQFSQQNIGDIKQVFIHKSPIIFYQLVSMGLQSKIQNISSDQINNMLTENKLINFESVKDLVSINNTKNIEFTEVDELVEGMQYNDQLLKQIQQKKQVIKNDLIRHDKIKQEMYQKLYMTPQPVNRSQLYVDNIDRSETTRRMFGENSLNQSLLCNKHYNQCRHPINYSQISQQSCSMQKDGIDDIFVKSMLGRYEWSDTQKQSSQFSNQQSTIEVKQPQSDLLLSMNSEKQ